MFLIIVSNQFSTARVAALRPEISCSRKMFSRFKINQMINFPKIGFYRSIED